MSERVVFNSCFSFAWLSFILKAIVASPGVDEPAGEGVAV